MMKTGGEIHMAHRSMLSQVSWIWRLTPSWRYIWDKGGCAGSGIGGRRSKGKDEREKKKKEKRKKKPVKTKYAATFTSITLASNLILFIVTSHWRNFIIPFLIKIIIETKMIIIVQWAPRNGINRLMGSNWSHLTNPKLPFPTWCLFISFAN